MPCADLAKESCKRRRVVARQGPEDAASGQVAADEGEDVGQDDDDEEADGAGGGAGRLLVDSGEGEEEGAGEDGVEVGDGVEDAD